MIMKKDIILFDMDGTLFDTEEGITKCARYALAAYGIKVDNLEKLRCFIGPPLADAFIEYYGFSKDDAKKAVLKFRERYSTTGVFECKEIAGVKECLNALSAAGKILCVATCKPEKFANVILRKFGLSDYFKVVVGSEMDEKRTLKEEVINEVFARLNEKDVENRSIMVGDRRHDILGAKLCNIQSIGIKSGFAEKDELEKAGADYIVNDFFELSRLLLKI